MIKSLSVITLLSAVHINCICQIIPGERSPIAGDEKRFLLELENSNTRLQRTEALLNLSAYYLYLPSEERDDLEKAIDYAQEAKILSLGLNFKDGYNEAMVLIGKTLNEGRKGDTAKIIFDSVTIYINQVIASAVKYNKPGSHARAIRQVADIHLSKGAFIDAEKILLELVAIYKKNGFPNLHYIYERLTVIGIITGDFNKALLFGLEMMRSMERTKDYASAGSFFGNMGYVYLTLKQFQKGLDYYNSAYDYFKKVRNSFLFDLKADIVDILIKMNRGQDALIELKKTLTEFPPQNDYENRVAEKALANCYAHLKIYDLAEIHLKKAIKIEQKQGNYLSIFNLYKKLAQVYTELGKYDMAKPYVQKCLSTTIFRPAELAQLHLMMYQIDSAAGNYLAAMKELRINKTFEDIASKEINTRENEELQLKYETEKKDQELLVRQKNIELLNKEKLLQASRLKQATTTQKIIIAGTCIIFLLLIFTYRRFKERLRTSEEINNKNRALLQLINEKEWLLKEVHHRVKNNLQTVVSLLESQSAYLQDDALLAIQESQNRVYAMSLIHQKLYQADNVASIDMDAYLRELVNYLRESFNTKNIYFSLQIAPLALDVSQAIPVGLIVNEAITNSIKYAFNANSSSRQIMIGLKPLPGEEVSLTISDNGIGMPTNLNGIKTGSLGLKLMKGLAEDLSGNFSINSAKGTAISIVFKANAPLHKIGSTGLLELNNIPV